MPFVVRPFLPTCGKNPVLSLSLSSPIPQHRTEAKFKAKVLDKGLAFFLPSISLTGVRNLKLIFKAT